MGNSEKIIRQEARNFYDNKIVFAWHSHKNSKDLLSDIRRELHNFYTPEKKAIYLDELRARLLKKVEAESSFQHQEVTEKSDDEILLFYVEQEISVLPLVARVNKVVNPTHTRDKIFVSYNRRDTKWLEEMERHFVPFQSKFKYWTDSEIQPGQKWKEEIDKALKQAKVAILLVSADFFASDFITTNELPPLLDAAENDGATILTVILRPCLFEEFPKLSQYQTVNNPSKPVSKMDENEREELWTNVVRNAKRVLEQE